MEDLGYKKYIDSIIDDNHRFNDSHLDEVVTLSECVKCILIGFIPIFGFLYYAVKGFSNNGDNKTYKNMCQAMCLYRVISVFVYFTWVAILTTIVMSIISNFFF